MAKTSMTPVTDVFVIRNEDSRQGGGETMNAVCNREVLGVSMLIGVSAVLASAKWFTLIAHL